jgi:polyphosphate kinase
MSPTSPQRRLLPALLSREAAILEFNRRVLAQARRVDVPLLERLRYICIVSSNMDEFFEVRFADYLEAARAPAPASRARPRVGRGRRARADRRAVRALQRRGDAALQREGIVILNHAERDEAQRRWVGASSSAGAAAAGAGRARPVAPVPAGRQQVAELHRALGGKDAFGRENTIAIVKVPRVLPRVIRCPTSCGRDGQQASCC